MRKDYEEKIEQSRELVEEHKDGIKTGLICAGLVGIGMIFGVKLCDNRSSAILKKNGYKGMERVLDAGARSMLDMIAEKAPAAIHELDKALKDTDVIYMKEYYLRQPEIISVIAKHGMKVK